MASGTQYPFWTHDTVAAAILAGVATASAQSRLDAWAERLNLPGVTALVHVWPVLMILAGLILLLLSPVEPHVPTGGRPVESTEISDDIRSKA